jgi:hypothetical protein
MSVVFHDLQDERNKLEGIRVGDPCGLRVLLDALRHREPFVFELVDDAGNALTIGLGAEIGFVQHSGNDGNPPYLMALDDTAPDDEGFNEFLVSGTPTPIPKKYCLPIKIIEIIAAEFVATGARSLAVAWDEI